MRGKILFQKSRDEKYKGKDKIGEKVEVIGEKETKEILNYIHLHILNNIHHHSNQYILLYI